MKTFDIDVSGSDILSKDYTICVADKKDIIRGFKFEEEIINKLSSGFKAGKYKYKDSGKNKPVFKIRLYSIIIYYILKSLKLSGNVHLNLCRDFYGKDQDIKDNLKFFLEEKLGLSIGDEFHFDKLDPNSNADKYSFLMRHDHKNEFKNLYVKITLTDIEKWLIKK